MTRSRVVLGGMGWVVLAATLVRCAWLADDAAITLRIVDNLLSGHGLRFNVAERVLVASHPLWMGLLVPVAWVADPTWAAPVLGGALTLVLAAGLVRACTRPEQVVLVFAALLGSAAFVDFSVSGLENPLAHLLVVATFAAVCRLGAEPTFGSRVLVIGLAALVVTDRLDHALLVGPALFLAVRGPWRTAVAAVLVGASPLVVWEAFSLVYYGVLVPNTALAKLGTGLGRVELARAGIAWLAWSARWDPVTPTVVAMGLGVAAVRRTREDGAAAAGIVLFLGWVVAVGGDHMGGRFLTPPFSVAVWLLARGGAGDPGRFTALLGSVGLAVIGRFAHNPPLTSSVDLAQVPRDDSDIVDERGYFYFRTGLWRRWVDGPLRDTPRAKDGLVARASGPHTVVEPMLGYFSLFAGPEVHVVDPVGLGDPLLARLPASSGDHRVGHWSRELPAGYARAAATGAHLPEPAIDAVWQDVLLVTRGPLFTVDRWSAIVRLLPPWRDPRVESWCERRCDVLPEDAVGDLDEAVRPHGIGVSLVPRRSVETVTLSGDPGVWEVRLLLGGGIVAETSARIGPTPERIRVSAKRVDQVRLLPPYPSAHLRSVTVPGRPADDPP